MELYIHIPFCVRKCDYCDFLSAPADGQTQAAYMEALERELCLAAEEYEGETIETVFIGGGTPSVVDSDLLCRLLSRTQERFTLEEGAEISMEANPGTLTAKKLAAYRQAGVNRLSIGLQSMDGRDLKTAGRIHTAEEFLRNFDLAREAGFANINVDLMSALPGQTVSSWERTLRRTADLKPEHISAYSLIIEEGTPFWDRYESHPELLPSEEEDRRMYHLTKKVLAEAGYERYEISNYARPGFACRHNMGYWKRTPYLGLGLGASSFYAGQRFRNTGSLSRYLELMSARELSSSPQRTAWREEFVTLTRQDAMEEFMFLGLRLTAGIRKEDFWQSFGQEIVTVYGSVLERLTAEGLLERTKAGWRLSEWGLDVSNRVLARFLLQGGEGAIG